MLLLFALPPSTSTSSDPKPCLNSPLADALLLQRYINRPPSSARPLLGGGAFGEGRKGAAAGWCLRRQHGSKEEAWKAAPEASLADLTELDYDGIATSAIILHHRLQALAPLNSAYLPRRPNFWETFSPRPLFLSLAILFFPLPPFQVSSVEFGGGRGGGRKRYVGVAAAGSTSQPKKEREGDWNSGGPSTLLYHPKVRRKSRLYTNASKV